jgi:hypothetical protein
VALVVRTRLGGGELLEILGELPSSVGLIFLDGQQVSVELVDVVLDPVPLQHATTSRSQEE